MAEEAAGALGGAEALEVCVGVGAGGEAVEAAGVEVEEVGGAGVGAVGGVGAAAGRFGCLRVEP